jgi:hypothetical protein
MATGTVTMPMAEAQVDVALPGKQQTADGGKALDLQNVARKAGTGPGQHAKAAVIQQTFSSVTTCHQYNQIQPHIR